MSETEKQRISVWIRIAGSALTDCDKYNTNIPLKTLV